MEQQQQQQQQQNGGNGNGTQPCPSCGHAIPASNMLMHSAFCRSTASSSPQQPASPAVDIAAEGEVVNIDDDQDEEDSEVMVLSPPPPAAAAAAAATSSHRRRVPPRPAQQPPGGAAAVVDLTGGPGVTPQQQQQQQQAAPLSGPAVVVVEEEEEESMAPPVAAAATGATGAASPRGQPKDDGAAATAMEEVQIQCDACTFANPPHVDFCQICATPLGGGGGGGMSGRMQAVGAGAGGVEEDAGGPPPGSCWTCPLCTFSGNRRGRWVCAACEVGRPRRQDMLDAEGEDGYVMVSGGRGGGGGGGRRPAAGMGIGGLDVPMRMLEDIMSGAAIGAVGGAATTALAGGGGPQTRQGMWRGAMFGALGGGLFGGMREMMALQQQQDAFDVDNASYEDLLNLFGPGHSPKKASVEAVSALPASRMTEEDVARLRREEAAGGGSGGASKECSICMDVFEAGDDVRSLPCLHRFHVACVDRWLTQHAATCPVCKMPILDNNGNNGGR